MKRDAHCIHAESKKKDCNQSALLPFAIYDASTFHSLETFIHFDFSIWFFFLIFITNSLYFASGCYNKKKVACTSSEQSLSFRGKTIAFFVGSLLKARGNWLAKIVGIYSLLCHLPRFIPLLYGEYLSGWQYNYPRLKENSQLCSFR